LTWRLELGRRAEKELASLPDAIMQRILDRLQKLAENPHGPGTKKLQGGGGYRLRVGDYRVLYDVFLQERVIAVYAVGHRRDVYRP
jgi:mRNA interferase RelE/StbE